MRKKEIPDDRTDLQDSTVIYDVSIARENPNELQGLLKSRELYTS
jgi:hypothetical protein